MLEKIKRYPVSLYKKLIQLNTDFENQGPLFQWLNESFALNPLYVESAQYFTKEATNLLQKKCELGELVFDLNPLEFLSTGSTNPLKLNCLTGEEL